jgi:hypothetical protein
LDGAPSLLVGQLLGKSLSGFLPLLVKVDVGR